MTIEITRPEIESLIHQRLQSGAFVDAEDVILRAPRSFAPEKGPVFDKQRALAAGARIRELSPRALNGQARQTPGTQDRPW